jgi:ribonuclease P protein component
MSKSKIDSRTATRSNPRLFGRNPASAVRLASRAAHAPPVTGIEHETNLSALKAPPRAYARLSRTHEDGRRPQGPRRPTREGPRTPLRLTRVADSPRIRESRYRLRGAGAFETVFASGRRYDGRFLQLIAVRASEAPGRVGYVIGRKSMRLAVDRNRLRRRLRERVRVARPALADWDVIVRVRRTVLRRDIAAAVDEATLLIGRLAGATR